LTAPDKPIPPATIRHILEEYHWPLPEGIELQVAKYMEVLALWGQKMSLTTIRDPEEVVRVQFGESIFALSLGSLPEGRLADVGTGAGFPGLAMKLALPEISVALIEPNNKKCAFLHEAVRTLGLTDVSVMPFPFRSAKINKGALGSIATRALAVDKPFLKWSHAILHPSGRIFLWLGEQASREVKSSGGAEWNWDTPALIPGSKQRYILRGAPTKA